MKKAVLVVMAMMTVMSVRAERVEMLKFGDMNSWVVRMIKESRIIGGNYQKIFAVGPKQVINENVPFKYGVDGNIWTVSNAYAKVMDIEKASGTTRPEKRGEGDFCARMDSKLDGITVMKMIDIKVMVAGTLFTGRTLEPVTKAGADDPYSCIDLGVAYTGHPIAMMLDYKADVANSNEITYAKATAFPKKREGRDCAEMFIYLQHRWEDEKGNIHAHRVGTGYERVMDTVPNWINDHRIPIRWGNISTQPGYKDYEGLNKHSFRAMNSQGKVKPIQEDGWGTEEPTHMIIFLTSSRYEAFVGHEGNTLWVDNVRLVYEK